MAIKQGPQQFVMAHQYHMVACTDAQSVYDHLIREGGLPSDKRLALDLAALRQMFGKRHEGAPGRR